MERRQCTDPDHPNAYATEFVFSEREVLKALKAYMDNIILPTGTWTVPGSFDYMAIRCTEAPPRGDENAGATR